MSDARSNTATATTATAESRYTGRFAPSPTGPLHLGSLVAAAGSYLDGRRAGGRWLVRIDDLDTARNQAGAEASILATLRAFGFRHHGTIVHQSELAAGHRAALDALARRGLLFACACTRREIAAAAGPGEEPRCVGDCRSRGVDPAGAALRVALHPLQPMRVEDRSGRAIHFDPNTQTDVVVRRRDGVVAYQLAVVVDDAAQGVTDVVRGGDLLPSTAWQLGLQQALGLPPPRYLHLPVVVEPDGTKLAKSRRSLPLDPRAAPATILRALELLGQPAPPPGARHDPELLWDWATAHWNPALAASRAEVRA